MDVNAVESEDSSSSGEARMGEVEARWSVSEEEVVTASPKKAKMVSTLESIYHQARYTSFPLSLIFLFIVSSALARNNSFEVLPCRDKEQSSINSSIQNALNSRGGTVICTFFQCTLRFLTLKIFLACPAWVKLRSYEQ